MRYFNLLVVSTLSGLMLPIVCSSNEIKTSVSSQVVNVSQIKYNVHRKLQQQFVLTTKRKSLLVKTLGFGAVKQLTNYSEYQAEGIFRPLFDDDFIISDIGIPVKIKFNKFSIKQNLNYVLAVVVNKKISNYYNNVLNIARF